MQGQQPHRHETRVLSWQWHNVYGEKIIKEHASIIGSSFLRYWEIMFECVWGGGGVSLSLDGSSESWNHG